MARRGVSRYHPDPLAAIAEAGAPGLLRYSGIRYGATRRPRRQLMRMIVLAAAACVAVVFAQVEARAEGAWCILDSDGCTSCSFQTRAQCVASATGVGGSSVRNPTYSASADVRARKQRSN
jgi:hypothetical protein